MIELALVAAASALAGALLRRRRAREYRRRWLEAVELLQWLEGEVESLASTPGPQKLAHADAILRELHTRSKHELVEQDWRRRAALRRRWDG